MIYDCMWPGCKRGDMEHPHMCCPQHFARLPNEMSLRLLFPNNPNEDWAALEDQIQKWAIEVAHNPQAQRLVLAIYYNVQQRRIHQRRVVADQLDAWLQQR